MTLLTCILTANDCYKTRQTIKPRGVMVHSTGANNTMLRRYVQPLKGDADYAALIAKLGVNPNGNSWNRSGTNACVHGFIGKLADGSIASAQTLPWNWRGWHAGTGTSGGSANNTHISFEICEDGLTDPAYFKLVYREAVELTAYLCKQYGLDPLADGVVICHSEGYRRGIASGHADVEHWFPKHGKSMNDFRRDVAAELGSVPAPEPEPARQFDKARAGTYTVTADAGLNIRAGAGTDKASLGVLPYGSAAVCHGYYSTVGGADWLLVAADGLTGYVSAGYLAASNSPKPEPEPDPEDGGEKEEDDMKYYQMLADVPGSYQPTIRKLMEAGALKGQSDPDPDNLEDNVLNISEDYCRVMTTLDRLGKLD